MKYDDPTLRDSLAAEYALGTLRGRARRRFERLMAEDAGLRDLVAGWEARLNGLAEAVAPVAPSPGIWAGIERQIGPAATSRPVVRRSWFDRLFGAPTGPVPTLASAGLWYCVSFWRSAGLATAAAAIALAIFVAVRPPAPLSPSHVALLAGEDARPVMLARLDAKSGHLEIYPVNLPAVPADRSLELWLVPAGGEGIRSLGVVDPKGYARELAPGDVAELATGALAISLEPIGGSPTGVATGPVIYVGPVVPAS